MPDIGNILTACAILISAAGLLFSMRQDQILRIREQADRIRDGASTVVAKLDRWKELSLHLFDELQIAATDVDSILVKGGDIVGARDYFWKNVVESQARVRRRVLDEQIEMSYSSLYGYDPRIHEFYGAAVDQLKRVDRCCFVSVLDETQEIIVSQETCEEGKFTSARLGNELRSCLGRKRLELGRDMDKVLDSFRGWMLSLVRAADKDLVNKNVAVPSSALLFSAKIESSGTSGRRTLLDLDRCVEESLEYPSGRGAGLPAIIRRSLEHRLASASEQAAREDG